MSIKLYYAPATRAVRPRWLLEEMGVPYELVTINLSEGAHKSDDYKRVHPLGKVPALVDDDDGRDVLMIESAAICLYLADRFPDKGMAPALDSPDRAAYYQWMVYSVATLEPAVFEIFRAGDDADKAAAARAGLDAAIRVLADGMRGPYVLGETFTAADVMIGSMAAWAASKGWLSGHDAIGEYVGRVTRRPAFAAGNGKKS